MKKFLLYLVSATMFLSSCGKQKANTCEPALVNESSKLITDWIALQLQVVRNTTGVTHVAYSRHFAYTGVALYESLVGGDMRYQSVAPQLNGLGSLPQPAPGKPLYWPAAANAAVAEMLRFFYPAKAANVAKIDSLENVYKIQYSLIINPGHDLDASISYGKQVAAAVIEWSKHDESTAANIPYTLRGEGFWEPTPTAFAAPAVPGWGNNKPMFSASLTDALPPAPISFSPEVNSPFYNMVKEVYEVSQSLSPEQKSIAMFWDDAPNGKYYTAFGHWFSILRQVLINQDTPMMEAADAFLRLGITLNDGSISCWKAKYTYHQMRPITYIRKYMEHADWNSFIGTPPHPEYSAAHATLSAAAAYSMESVFGGSFSFTDHSYDDINLTARVFGSFEEAGLEAGMSRLYGGIHYRPSIVAGGIQGKKVGQNIALNLKTLRSSNPH